MELESEVYTVGVKAGAYTVICQMPPAAGYTTKEMPYSIENAKSMRGQIYKDVCVLCSMHG